MDDFEPGLSEIDARFVMERGFCCVYAFRWEGSPIVKIGRSRNLYQRARDYLAACPNRLLVDDLIWVRTEKESIALEAALQLPFDLRRRRPGVDWFIASVEEILDEFELARIRHRPTFSSNTVVAAAHDAVVRQKFETKPPAKRSAEKSRRTRPSRATAAIDPQTGRRKYDLSPYKVSPTPEQAEIERQWAEWRQHQNDGMRRPP